MQADALLMEYQSGDVLCDALYLHPAKKYEFKAIVVTIKTRNQD
jgi:hypothetical protein